MSTEVDHLVVAAASLDDGARWCESTLGVLPSPGGQHPTMGTHNRLLKLSSPAFPQCYLEIIAIDAQAPAPQRLRWFGLDDDGLQGRLARHGPQLIHVVARSTILETHRRSMLNLGLNPGVPVTAHRDTPAGRLSWQILVRDDGRLEAGGLVPTLMQWDGPHATTQLPDQGCSLQALRLDGLPAGAKEVLRLHGVAIDPAAPPGLHATLRTPRGAVELSRLNA
ncbi:MAG: VOC family protein [Rubrivivax sp.]